jgi:PAS domain S-box-containing protein
VNTRCLTVDVTESRLAEERQKEADRRWRAAVDALPAAIYTTDAQGRITYYNEAAAQMSGRRPELGTDSWCVTWRLFNLDGTPLPHDECPMAVTLKENRPVRGVEAIAERPDGSRVRFQPFPTPLYDEQGKLVGAINLLVDVTEQRRAEADAARLAAIVESSTDAVISKTLDGVVTSWNEGAAQIFGYDASEMVGQHITRLIPPELHEEEREILGKLRRGERIEHFETVRVTKDGRRIDISLSVSPVQDKSGRLVGAAKVARDITQRKQAEETQQLLLGELNHRVKNTLATVQSIASQTLRRSGSPEEFVPSFMGRIRALADAHTLLTQSSWQGAEFGALVRDQVIADESDRISWSGPEIMLPAALSLHLALVLHELGTNARKHGALSGPRGHVTVAWSVSSGSPASLHLKWSETGGQPMHVEAPSKPGFGTTLIQRSMQSIEGGEAQMHVESNGISWTIQMSLPVSLSTPSRAAMPRVPSMASGERRQRGPGGRRVLVVEDEPLIAMDIAASLGDAGFDVVGPAGRIDEAIQLIAKSDFDGAFLDANLGGRSVDELAAALTRRNIPFAFITGYGRESLPAAFASGPMLTKPVDARALLDLAHKLFVAGNSATPLRREDNA